jgi:hypothetical protein
MNEINEYSIKFDKGLRNICDSLFDIITKTLINSKCKLYHGSPVWFINDNPIVGYSKKANKISLLFWSGQSFLENGLTVVGKFKAAEINYSNVEEIDDFKLQKWLIESQKIIWNYKDIRKNNGVLSLI